MSSIVLDCVFVVDFHSPLYQYTHIPHIILVTLMKCGEFLWVIELPDLSLVGYLPKLPSHGVEHHLGWCTYTRVFLVLGRVQFDTLSSFVLCNMLALFPRVVSNMGGPTTVLFF